MAKRRGMASKSSTNTPSNANAHDPHEHGSPRISPISLDLSLLDDQILNLEDLDNLGTKEVVADLITIEVDKPEDGKENADNQLNEGQWTQVTTKRKAHMKLDAMQKGGGSNPLPNG
ncbi:hypothetical protein RIF29_14299 [Crotalaria pallida]|uniref:Uncharacterized protein n=1 Tax=Crotalaria pallida TaxID=3830 RepID=A0AAN9IDM8_CROPI